MILSFGSSRILLIAIILITLLNNEVFIIIKEFLIEGIFINNILILKSLDKDVYLIID